VNISLEIRSSDGVDTVVCGGGVGKAGEDSCGVDLNAGEVSSGGFVVCNAVVNSSLGIIRSAGVDSIVCGGGVGKAVEDSCGGDGGSNACDNISDGGVGGNAGEGSILVGGGVNAGAVNTVEVSSVGGHGGNAGENICAGVDCGNAGDDIVGVGDGNAVEDSSGHSYSALYLSQFPLRRHHGRSPQAVCTLLDIYHFK